MVCVLALLHYPISSWSELQAGLWIVAEKGGISDDGKCLCG